mgnify:CR=1 FL=1
MSREYRDLLKATPEAGDDEEKGGMVPRGGSKRMRGKVLATRKRAYERLYRSDPYKLGGKRGAGALRRGFLGRLGFRR